MEGTKSTQLLYFQGRKITPTTGMLSIIGNISETFQHQLEATQKQQQIKEKEEADRNRVPYFLPQKNSKNFKANITQPITTNDNKNLVNTTPQTDNKNIVENTNTNNIQRLTEQTISSQTTDNNVAQIKEVPTNTKSTVKTEQFTVVQPDNILLNNDVINIPETDLANTISNNATNIFNTTNKNAELKNPIEITSLDNKKTSNTTAKLQQNTNTQTHSNRFEELKELKDRIIRQINLQIKLEFNGNKSDISLKLKPEFLGSMNIKLSLEENSSAVSFVVENQTVKELLQNSQDELKDAFAKKGFNVTDINIQVIGDQTQEDGHSRHSYEEQQATQEWLNSYINLDIEQSKETITENQSDVSEEKIINIIA